MRYVIAGFLFLDSLSLEPTRSPPRRPPATSEVQQVPHVNMRPKISDCDLEGRKKSS